MALSSTEAEFISASSAAQQLEWLIEVFKYLNLNQILPVTIYEDNIPCIRLSDSDKHQVRSKNITVKFQHLRDLKEKQLLILRYCVSTDMVVDAFKKPLPKPV